MGLDYALHVTAGFCGFLTHYASPLTNPTRSLGGKTTGAVTVFSLVLFVTRRKGSQSFPGKLVGIDLEELGRLGMLTVKQLCCFSIKPRGQACRP